MLDQKVEIWCTDSGQHSRAVLGAVLIGDEEVRPMTTRTAAPPWRGSGNKVRGTFDEDVVESDAPSRMIRNAPVIREDHNGRARWRFRCARCGRDVPMRADRFEPMVRDLAGIGERGFDVSMLPR